VTTLGFLDAERFSARAPSRHVRFTPKADMRTLASICPLCAKSGRSAPQQKASLFDHLVGEREQIVGDFDAACSSVSAR